MMLSIDREAQRERKRMAFAQTLLLWIIALGWLTTALGIIVLLLMTHAAANAVCLSKSEARKLWPKEHLYWYSPNHCWSNRRGKPHNLRYDLIRENHAQAEAPAVKIADAEQMPVAEKKVTPELPWPVAVKPIRIIEIIRPSIPMPVTPVEAAELPLLETKAKPPTGTSILPSILVPVSGALSAVLVVLFIAFSKRSVNYVKLTYTWIYRRIAQTGRQIAATCLWPRDKQSPISRGSIREIIRRVERRGHDDHLAKVLACCEDPVDEWQPPDNSALACWSRSIRAKENS